MKGRRRDGREGGRKEGREERRGGRKKGRIPRSGSVGPAGN